MLPSRKGRGDQQADSQRAKKTERATDQVRLSAEAGPNAVHAVEDVRCQYLAQKVLLVQLGLGRRELPDSHLEALQG